MGESGGAVYRLHGREDGCDLYVKHGVGQVANDLVAEMVRLRWLLKEGVSVPEVRHFELAQGEAWLVMTACRAKQLTRPWCRDQNNERRW